MRIGIKVLFVTTLAVMGAAGFASNALAAKATPTSGTFVNTSVEVLSEDQIGNVTIFTLHTTFDLTGSFAGTLDCDEVQIVKASGAAKFFDDCTFTGSYGDLSGTATIVAAGHSTPNGSTHGKTLTSGGTGDLAGIFGPGRIDGADGSGTYSGRVFFTGGGGDID